MLEEAITCCANKMIAAGFLVIPLSQHSKEPLVKWKGVYESPISNWTFQNANLAIITGAENGYVVVDCDSKESYKAWLATRPKTPLRVRSRRGVHFYYRHPGEYVKSNSHIKAPEGFEYDVKGDKSYCVMPPSIRSDHQYQICLCTGNLDGSWLRPERLPVFQMEWRPESGFRSTLFHDKGIKDVRRYIAHITAGEGERDKKTFRVAKLCRESNLTEGEAIAVTTDWHQTNVNPPWDPMEIIEKVRRVYASITP